MTLFMGNSRRERVYTVCCPSGHYLGQVGFEGKYVKRSDSACRHDGQVDSSHNTPVIPMFIPMSGEERLEHAGMRGQHNLVTYHSLILTHSCLKRQKEACKFN